MIPDRKTRIATAFSTQAAAYDSAAALQSEVAARLAQRIRARCMVPPRRILEIGCGTGLLSQHLAAAFPESDLLLTDIAPAMLQHCRTRLGNQYRYQILDGEQPDTAGPFDLIASSLAFQWFTDLPGALQRLSRLLAPGGHMLFTTLGHQTFAEWRQAHADFGITPGTPLYPRMEDLPWPAGFRGTAGADFILQPYPSGRAFIRSLKSLGAGQPAPGTRPAPTGKFRRLLASLEGGFAVTYHVLYGEISR